MRAPQTKRQIWSAPIILGLLSSIGLVAALMADGAGDIISWVMLAIPVMICIWSVRPFQNMSGKDKA